MQIQQSLSESTIRLHIFNIERFDTSKLSIQDFLVDIKQTKSVSSYANYLKPFKVYYRDFLKQPEIIQDYKFPKQSFKPKILPSKEEIRIFCNALSDRYKIIFLALASSGLRINELLNAEIIGNMVIPKSHNGQTKQAYISFINDETISLLKKY